MTAFLSALVREVLAWIERKLEKGHVAKTAPKDRRTLRRTGTRIDLWLRQNRASRGREPTEGGA